MNQTNLPSSAPIASSTPILSRQITRDFELITDEEEQEESRKCIMLFSGRTEYLEPEPHLEPAPVPAPELAPELVPALHLEPAPEQPLEPAPEPAPEPPLEPAAEPAPAAEPEPAPVPEFDINMIPLPPRLFRETYEFLPWYHATKESWVNYVTTHGNNGIVQTRAGEFNINSWDPDYLDIIPNDQ